MRKFVNFLIMLLFAIGFTSNAQKNSISARLNSLFYFKQDYRTSDSSNIAFQKTLQILPSLGYYRKVGKTVWVGSDISYKHTRYKVWGRSKYSFSAQSSLFTNSLPYQSIYACPAIVEVFNFKNLQIIPAFILPIEYVITRQQILNQFAFDTLSRATIYEEYNTRIWPKILKWGVYANLGIYHKIHQSLYAGIEIGVGMNNEIYFGDGQQTSKVLRNGIVESNLSSVQHYKKYYYGNMNFRPTVSLHYMW